MTLSVSKSWQKKLLSWFERNKRDFPWRHTKDPYAIWISEVMLQQTTSQAVIPYYKSFLKKFSNISSLAKADKKDLFPIWAGLGYYKRVTHLIQAAKELKNKKTFPKSHRELLKLPGFGHYISRAVSSLAFEESVGVVDGNVIRFLSRFYALPLSWWTVEGKAQLQQLSDLWIKNQKASQMNQALMELGSLVCKSKNPLCLLCPLMSHCQAHRKGLKNSLPLKKVKKYLELWHWRPERIKKNSKWAFVKNTNLPCLKGHFVFPGTAQKIKSKAKSYDFSHRIMHYQIFISVQDKTKSKLNSLQWFTQSQIRQLNPSSLIKKVFDH